MLIIAVLIAVIAAGVFTAVSAALSEVDVSTQPAELQPVIVIVKVAFTSTAVAVTFGFIRNITGFIVKWIRANRSEGNKDVTYSLKWFVETMVKFEGVILVATPLIDSFIGALPGEYKPVAMAATAAAFGFFDIVLSEVKGAMFAMKAYG